MGFLDTALRVGGAVATGGLSEVARAGYNAAKPDPLRTPEGLNNGQTSLGAGSQEPNPDFAAWQQRRIQIETAIASLSAVNMGGANDQKIAALREKLAAHDAARPPETRPTALGTAVNNLNAAGQQAQQQVQQASQALQQTGVDAAAQGQQVNAQAQQQAAAASNRAAPQMSPESQATLQQQQAAIDNLNKFNPATQGAAALRGFQSNQAGVQALNKFAEGPTGPSAAEAMLRLQSARDKAAAISRARSVRGGPGAVAEAMKMAQAEGAATSADTRGQLSLVQAQEAAQRRQEQLSALSAAGQLIGQQDQTQLQAQTAATQAELQGSQQQLQAKQAVIEATSRVRDQDINVLKSNLDARLQTMNLNDNQVRFFTGLGEAARQQGTQAMMDAQAKGLDAAAAMAQTQLQYSDLAWRMLATDQQVQLQKVGMEMGVDMNNAQQRSAFIGQLLGFAGMGLSAGAAASDRRVKRDIEKVRSMADALRATAGHSWNYKEPDKHGKGRYTGPMAQDLESRPEFRSAVKEVGGVKMVDATRLVMTHHAALHDLQKQIDRIAKRREKRS